MDEREIMRRRAFIAGSLSAAGLGIAEGVLDSAARLDPAAIDGSQARVVAAVEETVHRRALDFPTVPTVDQLPALVRDYAHASQVVVDVKPKHHRRVSRSLSYLAAFTAANLATWQHYDTAHQWYGWALGAAHAAGDREAEGWIAARGTLIAVQQGRHRQVLPNAAYAAMTSPQGQLGTTLGNAVAASSAARLGHRDVALQAMREAERAVQHRGEDTFTAYSLPWYRLGRFASEVHTQRGDTRRAQAIQDEASAGYPPGATTDLTFLALDRADCMAQDGYPQEAAAHATRTVLGLSPATAAPILLDRADEVADLIGPAGRSETEQLRHVVRHTRTTAA